MSSSKPTLEAPIPGTVPRRAAATTRSAEWMAYAQALRVAGYRIDADRLADQLQRQGCANVQDAFGNEVTVRMRLPPPPAPDHDDADVALAEATPWPARSLERTLAR